MTLDTTFEFEKRRNTPLRYDRELYVKTIKAMDKIDEIKTARKERFFLKRRLAQKTKLKMLAENEIEKNFDFLMDRNDVLNKIDVNEEKEENTQMEKEKEKAAVKAEKLRILKDHFKPKKLNALKPKETSEDVTME